MADDTPAWKSAPTESAGQSRRADVVILTALRLEYDALMQVEAGAVQGSTWEQATGPSGLPLAFRAFETPVGRSLRIAAAVAADMGATAAINTLLPLVEALKPRCVAMCGVCAGRPGKTELGDLVAASRVFFHDTGKQLPDHVQRDLATYQLREDWKAALAGMDVVARFRDAGWFGTRPLTAQWRERRALVALRNGDDAPWHDLDSKTWAATVAALQEQQLIAGRTLTDEGRCLVDDLLFRYQGRLPDLSAAGDFQPLRLHVGPLASGSQVIEDQAIWDALAQSVRTVLALEMEGAALGQLAHCQRQYGLDALVIKGVMDFASHERDDHFKPFAARASAECLIAFLRDHVQTEAIAGFDDLLTTGTAAVDQIPSPSSLLAARHTVVPWHDHGRDEILGELDAWADNARCDIAVRLLHAAGGVGKTRLAIEWVRRRRERGDLVGFFEPSPGDDWLDRLCAHGAPVLLVVDYAESRADLAELLDRLARYADVPCPRRRIRMLLLGRGDGDWWAELQKRSDAIGALLRRTAPIALSPLATTAPERDAVFAEAARVFAAVLGKPAVTRSPIALSDRRFERVLYLHMAALATLEGVAFDAGTLMDVILDHEERFWQTEAAARQQTTVDVELARELVCAATLRGGIATKDDVQDLCTRLARRPRSRDDDALIGLLRRVYRRAGEPRYLPGLEPDLLGEAVVVRVAATHQGTGGPTRDVWIDRVFDAGSDEQALTTAFTVMGRVSVTAATPVRAWIANMLQTDFAVRAVLALRAAKTVGQRTAYSLLGDVLADALEQHGSTALAISLDHEGVPYPTVSLQRVASWRSRVLLDSVSGDDETSVAQRARLSAQRGGEFAASGHGEAALDATREAVTMYHLLAERNPDAFQPDLARSLNNLGVDLSNLGERDAALEATREAVALRRQLAERNPDTFQPDLAGSLNNLGMMLSNLGQRKAALEAASEAVALYRQLADRNRDAFQPDLARSLNNQGKMLSNRVQRRAALKAAGEAVALYRQLAERNPDAFQPDLAMSLNNLGIRLSDLGQREAALEATREAAMLYRQLAERSSDAFQPYLARSLHNLGIRLSELGQGEAALEATREAAALYHRLAERDSDAFQPYLARSLHSLGIRLSDLGKGGAALEATREAVALRRQLAERNPDTFQPYLARSLHSLGIRLSKLGHREQALEATREVVALRRQLAGRKPDAFQPDLATSLNNLSFQLSELGHREAAVEATREVVSLYRQLAERNPHAFQPDLASSLDDLGIRLSDLGQREAAVEATREAVSLYHQLAERNPHAFQPCLALGMHNLSVDLNNLGERETALQFTREAVTLYRELAERAPDAFQPNLARSLYNLGIQLSDLGERGAAFDATHETVTLYRKLAERAPDAFQPYLARSLNNFGMMLSNLGQRERALKATREAVALRRQLAERVPDTFQPDLARSLNNLGIQLSDLGERRAALETTREAVTLYRQLFELNPDVFRPDLASSLHNLSMRLSSLKQREAALEATREAVALYRQLFELNPDVFQPDLASSLHNLSVDLSDLGRHDAALEATREAAALRRQLADRNPDAFQADLASSLHNLGRQLSDLGQREAALEATREAVALCRQLAEHDPCAKGNLGGFVDYETALEATRDAKHREVARPSGAFNAREK